MRLLAFLPRGLRLVGFYVPTVLHYWCIFTALFLAIECLGFHCFLVIL
jgi:hypothetical protein